MAAAISPLASAGVEGITTFKPGIWADQACRLCECCGPRLPPTPTAVRTHQRDAELAGGHVVDLGRLIDQLVHDQRDEIAEHHLEDRPLPGHGGADRDAECAGFRDRRIDHALGAELREQPIGLLEHAAGGADILAHQDDRVVEAHFAEQRFQHCGAIGGGARARHAGGPQDHPRQGRGPPWQGRWRRAPLRRSRA